MDKDLAQKMAFWRVQGEQVVNDLRFQGHKVIAEHLRKALIAVDSVCNDHNDYNDKLLDLMGLILRRSFETSIIDELSLQSDILNKEDLP